MAYTYGNKFENILVDDILHPIFDQRVRGDNFKYYSIQEEVIVGTPFSQEALNALIDIKEHIQDGCIIFIKSLGLTFLPFKVKTADVKYEYISTVDDSGELYKIVIQYNDSIESAIINKLAVGSYITINNTDFTSIKEGTTNLQKIVDNTAALELSKKVLDSNAPCIVVTTDEGYPYKQYDIAYTTSYNESGIMLEYSSNNGDKILVFGKPPIGSVPSVPWGALIISDEFNINIDSEKFNQILSYVIDLTKGYNDSDIAKEFGQKILNAQPFTITEIKLGEYPDVVYDGKHLNTYFYIEDDDGKMKYEDQNGHYIEIFYSEDHQCNGVLINTTNQKDVEYGDTTVAKTYTAIQTKKISKHNMNMDTLSLNNFVYYDIDKIPTGEVLPKCLYFESDSEFTLKTYFCSSPSKTLGWKKSDLEFSTDLKTWHNIKDYNYTIISQMYNNKHTIFLRGINGKSESINEHSEIFCEGATDIHIGGKLSAIIKYNTGVTIAGCPRLFNNCAAYLDASDLELDFTGSEIDGYDSLFGNCVNLKKAAFTLTKSARYNGMFKGCTSLTIGPNISILNAPNTSTFDEMFDGCSSLSIAPTIELDRFAGYMFLQMFNNCTALEYPPMFNCKVQLNIAMFKAMFKGCVSLKYAGLIDNINDIPTQCFQNMFEGCKNLSTVLEINYGEEIGEGGCKQMYLGCESLISSPEINVQTIREHGCEQMFKDCIGLTQSNNINVNTIKNSGMYGMFEGCKNLITVKPLTFSNLDTLCCGAMFKDCIALQYPPVLNCNTTNTQCYSYMFANCESLLYAPALQAESVSGRSYEYMFSGCSALRVCPTLNAMVLDGGSYIGMFVGCTSLKAPAALPATTLPSGCYNSMFAGCTGITWANSGTEYRIPSSGTASGTGWGIDMFKLNSGSIPEGTGTPLVNTTYYYTV